MNKKINLGKSQNDILHVNTSPYVKIEQDPGKRQNFTGKAIYAPFASSPSFVLITSGVLLLQI